MKGFTPNTTPTPNWLFNGELKKMNETQLKVVLLVTRKTLGWFDPKTEGRKDQDYISQSQFIEYTGQGNRAIATAIQGCVEQGWIIARDGEGNTCETPEKRTGRKVWYQLGDVFTEKISGAQSTPDKSPSSAQSTLDGSPSSAHFDNNPVHNVHSTKETLTKENNCEKEFSQEDYLSYLQKLQNDKQKHIRIIGIYLQKIFDTHGHQPFSNQTEAKEVIKRHLRAAKKISSFGNEKIMNAMETAFNKVKEETTLETVHKYLTK